MADSDVTLWGKQKDRAETTKTYLLSGMKSKINTELRMKWEKSGTCGDAGWTEGLAHSVTLSRPKGTAVSHTHTYTHDSFPQHIPAAKVGYSRRKEQKVFYFPNVRGKWRSYLRFTCQQSLFLFLMAAGRRNSAAEGLSDQSHSTAQGSEVQSRSYSSSTAALWAHFGNPTRFESANASKEKEQREEGTEKGLNPPSCQIT